MTDYMALILTPDVAGNVTAQKTLLPEAETSEGLQRLHEIVNGYIEVVRIDKDFALLVNDEGALYHDRVYNPVASMMYGGDIFGVAVCVGIKSDPVEGDLVTDCPQSIIKRIYSYFAIADYIKKQLQNGGRNL